MWRSLGVCRLNLDSFFAYADSCLTNRLLGASAGWFVKGGFRQLNAIVAKSFAGEWGFAPFNAIHVLIYGAAFYWIGKGVSNKLASLPRTWKILRFATVSMARVDISILPLYGVGHNAYQPLELYRLRSMVK